MKSHLPEKIYLASPVWVQNFLVSIYGYLEHGRRYGGAHKKLLVELYENEFKTQEEIKKIADAKLEYIINVSVNHVPYYQKLGLKKTNLQNFPVLDRQTVSDNTESFVNQSYPRNSLLPLFTGGSSGHPLKVYITKEIRQKSYAFWSKFYKRMDFEIGDRKASFVGRKLQDPDNDTPPFWRYNFKDRQLIFSSYHMSDKNLPLYLDKLNKFKPKVIEGYPLSIYRLAEFIIQNSINIDFKLNGISTSSENFTYSQRKVIEEAFDSKVYDQYGSAESVVFAAECDFGTMHIEPEYGVVEVLTKEGTVKPDGSGELLVTTLLNDAMPLIRYRIGDFGEVGYAPCQCGRETPVLKHLDGKVGAVIVSENKSVPTAAIAIAFEYLEGVKHAQIIQNEPDQVIVRLVKKPDFIQESEDFMIWELRKMLGNKLKISVEYVDEIPPSSNGKYKMVVQNYFKP